MPIDLNISNTQNSPSVPSVEGESIQNIFVPPGPERFMLGEGDCVVSDGRILSNTGQPLEMYDSYDNIPLEIREPLIALNESLYSSGIDARVAADVRNAIQNLLNDVGNHSVPLVLQYIQYLHESLRTVRSKKTIITKQVRANTHDNRSKLFAPIGIEFAYHHPQIKKNKPKSRPTEFRDIIPASECTPDNSECACGPDESCGACDVVPVNQAVGISQTTGRLHLRQAQRNPQTGIIERTPWNNRRDTTPRTRTPKTAQFYTNQLEILLTESGLMQGFGAKVYKDGPDTVEVCTPIHKNWKSLMDWFIKCDSIAKLHGYKPWRRSIGGGGMHLNISYNKTVTNWKLAYTNFFIMVANYPQLNWIFNEPGDNHTANALVTDARFIKAYHMIVTNGMSDKAWSDISVCGGKGRSINCKDEYHFELRTFEMVRSPQELHDVITLINTLLGFCMEVAEWGVLIPLEVEIPIPYIDDAEERGYWLDEDISQSKLVFSGLMWTGENKFNSLLKQLGLNPKTYKKYIRRNYYARRAQPYGKKFFV